MTDFGRDISCTTALRTGTYATGKRLVAEAIFRRLTTPPGSLLGGDDEANYGLDLLSLVGAGAPQQVAATLPARIRTEVRKDQRVLSADVSVSWEQNGPAAIYVTMTIETDLGPFDLTISVGDVDVALVGFKG